MIIINYNNKEYKLPFGVELSEDPTTTETIENRFGGDSCVLPTFAIAVYDMIIGAEAVQDWNTHRQGLDWFAENFSKEYMVLLD